MNIRPVSGCIIGKGMFASFAHYEEAEILPLRLVAGAHRNTQRTAGLMSARDSGQGFWVQTGCPGGMKGHEFKAT